VVGLAIAESDEIARFYFIFQRSGYLGHYYSSLFNICGDGKVGPARAMAYLGANMVNNVYPFLPHHSRPGWSLIPSRQQSMLQDLDWDQVEQGLSPTRTLSNIFWMTLPWQNIRNVLGGKLHVLDVGCGSGDYFDRLQSWTHGMIHSYRGIDVQERPNWGGLTKTNPQVSFQVIRSLFSASDILPETNLVITQSAIEHFEFDVLFFREIRKFVDRIPNPLLQIHLVPSAACLWLYVTHGYRQYTPHTIDKMTACFSERDTQKILVPLGGRHCNRLHFSALTLSRLTKGRQADQRKTNPPLYERQLSTAILKDAQRPAQSPSFYAVILASHLRLDLRTVK